MIDSIYGNPGAMNSHVLCFRTLSHRNSFLYEPCSSVSNSRSLSESSTYIVRCAPTLSTAPHRRAHLRVSPAVVWWCEQVRGVERLRVLCLSPFGYTAPQITLRRLLMKTRGGVIDGLRTRAQRVAFVCAVCGTAGWDASLPSLLRSLQIGHGGDVKWQVEVDSSSLRASCAMYPFSFSTCSPSSRLRAITDGLRTHRQRRASDVGIIEQVRPAFHSPPALRGCGWWSDG
jgi:hypothetical protein